MSKHPENEGTYLYNILFQLFPGAGITPKITSEFQRAVDKWSWCVHETGELFRNKFSGLPQRHYVVDIEDKDTLASLKILAHLETSSVTRAQKESFRIAVHESHYDEDDWVIWIKGKLYLKSFYDAYNAMHKDFSALMSEVEKEEY